MRTRAAVLERVGDPLRFEEIVLNPPEVGEVLVKIHAAGVCHSDVHYWSGAIPRGLPMVLGHEGVGTVLRVGEGVSSVEAGDQVVLSFLPACGKCYRCADGESSLCTMTERLRDGTMPDGTYRLYRASGEPIGNLLFISAFAEHAVVPEASVVRISEDLPWEEVCLLGCGFSTGFGAVTRALAVGPGDTVVILGAGGVGLAAVQGARVSGAWSVVVDAEQEKIELAKRMGAKEGVVNDGDNEGVIARIREALGSEQGADYCVEAVGGGAIVDTIRIGFESLREGGVLAVTGLGAKEIREMPISPLALVTSQKQVRGVLFGSVRVRSDLPRFFSMMRSGLINVKDMIGDIRPFGELNDVLERMSQGRQVGRAVVVMEGEGREPLA